MLKNREEKRMKQPSVGIVCLVGVVCFCVGRYLNDAVSQVRRSPSPPEIRADAGLPDDGSHKSTADTCEVVEELFDDGSQKRVTLDHGQGEWKSVISYYPDGKIRALETFDGRTREGICVSFEGGETLRSLGIYREGGLVAGMYRQFYARRGERHEDDGEARIRIERVKRLHEDRTTGVRTDFREDGKVWSVAPYMDDHRHGVMRWYDKEGRLDIVEEYEYGNCVKKTGYDGDRKKYIQLLDD